MCVHFKKCIYRFCSQQQNTQIFFGYLNIYPPKHVFEKTLSILNQQQEQKTEIHIHSVNFISSTHFFLSLMMMIPQNNESKREQHIIIIIIISQQANFSLFFIILKRPKEFYSSVSHQPPPANVPFLTKQNFSSTQHITCVFFLTLKKLKASMFLYYFTPCAYTYFKNKPRTRLWLLLLLYSFPFFLYYSTHHHIFIITIISSIHLAPSIPSS